jgi:hypothetical protein
MSGWCRRGGLALVAVLAVLVATGADRSGCSRPPSSGNTSSDAAPCPHASDAVRCWAQRVVYVEDHTGDGWPVTGAVAALDRALIISVRYGRCRDGAGCVRVSEKPTLTGDYLGLTHTWASRSTHEMVRDATVELSDVVQTSTGRWDTTLHELIHAMGWNQHDSTGLMRAFIDVDAPGTTRYGVPPADAAALNAAYR